VYFQTIKNLKYTFLQSLVGRLYPEIFIKMIIVTSLVLRTRSISAVFCPPVFYNLHSVIHFLQTKGLMRNAKCWLWDALDASHSEWYLW